MKLKKSFFALAMIILMVGCSDTSQSTMTAASTLPIATWTPVSPAEAKQNPDVREPLSPPAELGKTYPFQLYTHCGADLAVDFDGSFWQLSNPAQVPESLGDPSQEGTMTLIDPDHARFDFEGGSLLFIRHQGPKYILPCA
ncbi:MAG TPA: hypothetical protein VJM08_14210 [Anaerolineales bacterium]|nr:hypothetical protein [Anaerolineales bacterium]